jgi:S-adenosylmethionine:tRNA ribosyltransferase-isomerase
VLVSDFDFYLPERLIAQEPAPRRDASRLLVVNRAAGTLTDAVFHQLPDFLQASDLLVMNNTRVFPARLIGHLLKENQRTTKEIEVFLVREDAPLVWEALVRPGKAMREGACAEFGDGELQAEVIEWQESGRRLIRFKCEGDFNDVLQRLGRTPLPPYIKRDADTRLDQERYQTVFARERGAIAAPTAGLHFTEDLLKQLRGRGIDTTEITLHVGYGTFQPVKVERVEDHKVEAERFSINPDAAAQINAALNANRRIVAVGTTTTRALESTQVTGDRLQVTGGMELRKGEAGQNDNPDLANQESTSPCHLSPVTCHLTDLFIYPGFTFNVIGGLITNFHLPQSSLLMLVSAFAGRELIFEAYHHAVKNEYRFYSYGDAMLIL